MPKPKQSVTPKVSVILTSYNHARYLREAIDSVLNQTFTDFELIIWDDASSDNSWQLIEQYSDPRIKSFRNEEQKRGVWGINQAIATVATGKYVAIHHSDDVWELDKLEKQVAYLDANASIGAVFTWVQIIDEQGAKSTGDWFDQENKTRWQWLNGLFLEQNHLNHPSVLIRKQCYQDVGGYRYGLAQTGDAEMWSRVLIKYPIHVIQEKLTKHRLFSDQSNTSGPRIEVAIRVSNEWNVLRENCLSIRRFQDIVSMFPSLERFRNPKGFDAKFLFAMACLYECKQRSAWQLGLKWLFDLLNDEIRKDKIKELYSFSYMDFIKLTAELDVYAISSLVEREQSIAALQTQVEGLLKGNSWMTSQREAWHAKSKSNETRIAELIQAMDAQAEANAWLSSQREAWEKQSKAHEARIGELTLATSAQAETIAKVNSQREAWETQAKAYEARIAELTQAMDAQAEASATLSSQREAWETQAKAHEARIGELTLATSAQAETIAKVNSQREAWETQAKAYEARIAELTQAMDAQAEASATLSSQREAWETQAKAYEARIAELTQAMDAQAEASATFSSQREAWKTQAKAYEARIAELTLDMNAQVEANAWLNSQREAWEIQVKAHEARIIELTQMMEAQAGVNARLISQREALGTQAKAHEAHITELTQAMNAQEDANAKLISQREAVEAKVKAHEAHITELTQVMNAQAEANARLTFQCEAWETRAKSHEENTIALESRITGYKLMVDRIRTSALMRLANILAGKKYF